MILLTVANDTAQSFSEKIAEAGQNTLICICVVFVVLIFISLVISLFQFIPKAEKAIAERKKRKEEEATIGESAIDHAITQIEANEAENMVDDCELVAVIAAAIAASTGASTDDFVVRSIRKIKRA